MTLYEAYKTISEHNLSLLVNPSERDIARNVPIAIEAQSWLRALDNALEKDIRHKIKVWWFSHKPWCVNILRIKIKRLIQR